MNKNFKGIIALDLDGTLTSSKRDLEPEVRCYLENLNEQGWKLIFITGRFFSFAYELLNALSCPYILAVQNGAMAIDILTEEVLFSHYLSSSLLKEMEKITENLNFDWLIESGMELNDEIFFVDENFPSSSEEKQFMELCIKVYFPGEKKKKFFKNINKLSLDYPHPYFAAAKLLIKTEDLFLIKERLELSGLKEEVNCTGIFYPADPKYSVVHVTHPLAEKGKALEQIITNKKWGEHIFIISGGDDENDRGLLSKGTFKIVMNTAPSQMFSLADYLAPPAKDLGIIKGLKEALKYYANTCSKN